MFAEIAIANGFKYGARLPNTVYGPVYFADQEYKRPDRSAYMRALAQHRPYMATVLDLETDGQLPEVLSWAEEAAQYVERVLLIPKSLGCVKRLPRRIGRAGVVLAYSVPTTYGGTLVPFSEFYGWPLHFLGGSPQMQLRLWRHFSRLAEVVSVDGNMAQKMATRFCSFWRRAGFRGRWISLKQEDGERWEGHGTHEAFRRSCVNIQAAWQDEARRGESMA